MSVNDGVFGIDSPFLASHIPLVDRAWHGRNPKVWMDMMRDLSPFSEENSAGRITDW
jgi:hypothetical protein